MGRKNPCLYLIFFILICAPCSLSSAENLITLKDGSEIRGHVVSLQNNTYTVQTSFGPVQISDSQIQNISMADAASPSPGNPASSGSYVTNQFGPEASAIQQKMFSNPRIMTDIQKLLQDPEVVKLLNDPSFVNDVTSTDKTKMINNPKVQQLLQNQNIQNIMNALISQMGQEQPQ